MVIERWLQIKRLFDAAHEKPAAVRARFLEEACGADLELRTEVESLFACEDSAGGFLESEAADIAPVPKAPEPVAAGERIGPYTIQEPLGVGGMGEVYKAYDNRLDRLVAIKFLSCDTIGDSSVQQRLEREARAASALNHPNICTVHDVGHFQARSFIVMELLEGQTLKERMVGQPVPLAEFSSISRQVCTALQAAHGKGIVHLDVKPANIFVMPGGQVKILDFGLARRGDLRLGDSSTPVAPLEGARLLSLSAIGTITGTLAYMSPEQAVGEDVDERTDIFSLGVVLFELATGQRPFRGRTAAGIIGSILTELPPRPSAINRTVRARLDRVILKALEKDREARYQSVALLFADLNDWQRSEARASILRRLRKPRVLIPALLLLAALLTTATWYGIRIRRIAWARNIALPEVSQLLAREDFDSAFRLGREAERYVPDDPELLRLRLHYEIRQSVSSDPPGADVYVKGYLNVGASWIHLGKSPIHMARIPRGHDRWRVVKDGFEPVEGAFSSYSGLALPSFKLHPAKSVPPGMVWIPGGTATVPLMAASHLEGYWLDKYEVSNERFKEFMERGGYERREYWTHRFIKDGRLIPWERAMAEFRDATGRPGPSTWQWGTFPQGQANFPVRGVSWYEAAAYAEFAEKSLPAVYQWHHAAGNLSYSDILRLSNFGESGRRHWAATTD